MNLVTNEVISMQSNIPNILKDFEIYLEDRENEPNIDIGKQCNSPYECDAKEYCWKVQRKIPDYSIFNIFNLRMLNMPDKTCICICMAATTCFQNSFFPYL